MDKFICEQCGKELANLNTYNSHLTWHESQKRYPNGLDCPVCNNHCKAYKGLTKHITIQHKDLKDQEFAYKTIHNIKEKPKCSQCDNKVVFISFRRGYSPYCENTDCQEKGKRENYLKAMEEIDYSKFDYTKIVEKRRKTVQEKYGVDNVMCNDDIKNRIRETNKKRYGVEWASQSKASIEKRNKYNLEKYGCKSPMGDKKVQEKSRKTVQEKYGVDNILQSELIKNKIKQNYIKIYGVENISQAEEIKKKKEATMLKNYGTKHFMQSDIGKENLKKVNLEKYGVEHFCYTNAFKNKMKEYWQDPDWRHKIFESRKTNKQTMSKQEDLLYEHIVHKYGKNVERQKSDRPYYSWPIDFYIPDYDVLVNFHGYWMHYIEPFDINNDIHIDLVNYWESKNTPAYNTAIKVFTEADPLKIQTAEDYNLNYIAIYDYDPASFMSTLNSYINSL